MGDTNSPRLQKKERTLLACLSAPFFFFFFLDLDLWMDGHEESESERKGLGYTRIYMAVSVRSNMIEIKWEKGG